MREQFSPYDVLRIALVVLLLFTIGRLHSYFAPLAALRPALLATGVAIGYSILVPSATAGREMLRTTPARIVLALLFFVLGSALFGLSLGGSARYILDSYSKVIVLWLLLVISIRHVGDLRLLVWGYLLGAAVLTYMSVFVYELNSSAFSATARLDDSQTHMYDPNDIGVILMSALPLAVLAISTSRLRGKLVAIALVLGIGAAVARSGSRGGFVGLLVVGVGLLFLIRGVSLPRRLVTLVLVSATLAVAAPDGYWDQMKTIVTPTEDYNWSSTNGRREIAKRGFGYMMSYPVFGVGIANFGRAECTTSELSRFSAPGTLICAAPHNSYLQAGAETGFAGLALWTAMVFGNIVGLLRLRRRLPRHWVHADPDRRFIYNMTTYLAVALLGFGATSLFVSFAWLDPIYILVAFTSGTYVLATRLLADEDAGPVTIGGPLSEWRSRRTLGVAEERIAS